MTYISVHDKETEGNMTRWTVHGSDAALSGTLALLSQDEVLYVGEFMLVIDSPTDTGLQRGDFASLKALLSH